MPFLLTSSTIIRIVSFKVVSLIAIVPESECNTPILIAPWVWAAAESGPPATSAAASAACPILLSTFVPPSQRACGQHRRSSKIEATSIAASGRFWKEA